MLSKLTSIAAMLCLCCHPSPSAAAGGWLAHSPKVALSEDGMDATAAGTGMDGWTSACGHPMEGGGRHYVEVEWVAGDKLMVGVAGGGFDPTDAKQDTRSSTDGWAYSAWSDGRLYHGGKGYDWAGEETGASVGDRIGLLLDYDKGTLTLRINESWYSGYGHLVDGGLKPPLRWSVDLFADGEQKTAVRMHTFGETPPPSDPAMERLLRDTAKKGDAAELAELLEKGSFAFSPNKYGQTALIVAANRGHFDCVQALIAAGAAVGTKDEDGNTALDKAVSKEHEDTATLLRLWAMGGAVERRPLPAVPSDGAIERQLRDTAKTGDATELAGLLEKGASVDAPSKYGQTALIVAANRGQFDCVKVLLAAGAAVGTKDEDGNTALDKAVSKEHEDTATLLRLWAKGSEDPKEKEKKEL